MILFYIVKKLLLIGLSIHLSNAEIDSATADAISQVRFVQYQPIIPKKLQLSTSNNAAAFKELDTKETGYYRNSVERPTLQQNKSPFAETETDDKLVPKNYAFSYAIRDRNSGDDFSHRQAHNGEATKGEYRVKLPDGRTQVVTYTADNGGYRADIRYDTDEMEGQSNNGVYVTKGFSEEVSPSIKRPTNNANLARNSFAPNLFKNDIGNKKISDKISDSPHLYFNQVRSFGVPSSTDRPASYETIENTDEELFPYSKKLLDDVNYLLKYVTPTIESKHEDKNFADFSKNKFLNTDPYFKEKFKDEPLQHEDKFELPPNFPYQFSKFEEPKFEKLSFNGPNIDEQTFIEPSSIIGPKHEEPRPHQSKFEKSRQEAQSGGSQIFDSSPSSEFKFKNPTSGERFEGPRYNNPRANVGKINSNFGDRSKYNGPRLEDQRFEKTSFDDRFKYNAPRQEGQRFENSNFDNTQFHVQKSQELKLDIPGFDTSKYDESILEGQSASIQQQEEPNYNVEHHETPQFNSQQFNENNFEQSKYENQGFTPSHFEGSQYETSNFNTPNFNDPKFSVPSPPNENIQQNSQSDGQSNSGKAEIPQYIHIHRYEASGEDQTNNARPKELIYYNPLQIPVPNSIAYMEQGTYNYSNPQYVTLTPSYITMTEHPRIRPTDAPSFYRDNVDIPDFASKLNNLTKFQENYLEPIPAQPAPPSVSGNYENAYNHEPRPLDQPPQNQVSGNYENTYNHEPHLLDRPPQNQVTTQPIHQDHDTGNYENTIGGLPPFDPRTYSGYFDFLPSAEVESEGEKLASPPAPSYPAPTQQSEQPKNELPQYYYDFSTASPAHKYVSSAEASQEQFQTGFDANQIRNASFLASAYLRPLHKERVYIHHNSQPTTPAEENFLFPATTLEPKQARQKEADVQIIKSISSTIPPELLKDFDYQLSSPLFTSRSDDNRDANSEHKEIKILQQPQSKLNADIVKKLQSALATNGKVYLKAPSQRKSVVR